MLGRARSGLADQAGPRRSCRSPPAARPTSCRARCSSRSRQQVGQTFIVENRPGGGTTIGSAQVEAADPDGHTILVHSNALVTVPAIQANVPYDPVKDFSGDHAARQRAAGAGDRAEQGHQDGEGAGRRRPRPSPVDSTTRAAGIGTPPHLTMERFRLAAGFDGPARAVQGRAGGADRGDDRPRRHLLLPDHAGDAADPGRQAAGARGVSSSKRASRAAGRADHDRSRLPEFRFRFLGRRVRAEEDAARRRRQDARRDRQGARESGDQGAARQARRRADDHEAGGVRRADRARRRRSRSKLAKAAEASTMQQ